MKIDWQPLGLKGAFWAKLPAFADFRGSFQKMYHTSAFAAALPGFVPREAYLTTSHRNVLRGMHFQLPPADHAKVVICLSGQVLDVAVDLRPGADFGKLVDITMSGDEGHVVALPVGLAHGFLSQQDDSRLLYVVGTEHAPDQDSGVLWSSIGYDWPVTNPILSARDNEHPTLEAFAAGLVEW